MVDRRVWWGETYERYTEIELCYFGFWKGTVCYKQFSGYMWIVWYGGWDNNTKESKKAGGNTGRIFRLLFLLGILLNNPRNQPHCQISALHQSVSSRSWPDPSCRASSCHSSCGRQYSRQYGSGRIQCPCGCPWLSRHTILESCPRLSCSYRCCHLRSWHSPSRRYLPKSGFSRLRHGQGSVRPHGSVPLHHPTSPSISHGHLVPKISAQTPFSAYINFHDTHSGVYDFACKSQRCAIMGKFCANVVSDHKRAHLDFCTRIIYNKLGYQETKNIISLNGIW